MIIGLNQGQTLFKSKSEKGKDILQIIFKKFQLHNANPTEIFSRFTYSDLWTLTNAELYYIFLQLNSQIQQADIECVQHFIRDRFHVGANMSYLRFKQIFLE